MDGERGETGGCSLVAYPLLTMELNDEASMAILYLLFLKLI